MTATKDKLDRARKAWLAAQAQLPAGIRDRLRAGDQAARLAEVRTACFATVREYLKTLGSFGASLWDRREAEPPLLANEVDWRMRFLFDGHGLHDLSLVLSLEEHGPRPDGWVVHLPGGDKLHEIDDLDGALAVAAEFHPTT